jgi:hypothetical protein
MKKFLCRVTGHLPGEDVERLDMSRSEFARCLRCGCLVGRPGI